MIDGTAFDARRAARASTLRAPRGSLFPPPPPSLALARARSLSIIWSRMHFEPAAPVPVPSASCASARARAPDCWPPGQREGRSRSPPGRGAPPLISIPFLAKESGIGPEYGAAPCAHARTAEGARPRPLPVFHHKRLSCYIYIAYALHL